MLFIALKLYKKLPEIKCTFCWSLLKNLFNLLHEKDLLDSDKENCNIGGEQNISENLNKNLFW